MVEIIALLYQELCYRRVCYKSVPLYKRLKFLELPTYIQFLVWSRLSYLTSVLGLFIAVCGLVVVRGVSRELQLRTYV